LQRSKAFFLLPLLVFGALFSPFPELLGWACSSPSIYLLAASAVVARNLELQELVPSPLIALGLWFFVFATFYPAADRIASKCALMAALRRSRSMSARQPRQLCLKDMIDNNFIFGVGAGNYTLALVEKFPSKPAYSYQPVHNSYLLLWSEQGLLPGSCFSYSCWSRSMIHYIVRGDGPKLAILIYLITVCMARSLVAEPSYWHLVFLADNRYLAQRSEDNQGLASNITVISKSLL
jgi:hypothetical protein